MFDLYEPISYTSPCEEPPEVPECPPEEPPECPVDCEPYQSPECPTEEPEKTKGNNGWGNGEDGDNPGTNKGNDTQKASKNNEDIPDKFMFQGFNGR
jgi:hypothetical protein